MTLEDLDAADLCGYLYLLFEQDNCRPSEIEIQIKDSIRSNFWETLLGHEYKWVATPRRGASKGYQADGTYPEEPDDMEHPLPPQSKEYIPATDLSMEGLMMAGLDAPLE